MNAVAVYLLVQAASLALRKLQERRAPERRGAKPAALPRETAPKSSRDAQAASAALPPPPPFDPPGQSKAFTHDRRGIRTFDHDITQRMPELLVLRSVVPLEWAQVVPAELAEQLSAVASVWAVVPLTAGAENAAQCLERIRNTSPVVLASLTLAVLPVMPDVPVLLVAGDASCEQIAGPNAPEQFGMIAKPVVIDAPAAAEPAPEQPPAPAAQTEPAPAPAPAPPVAMTNGIAHDTSATPAPTAPAET